MTNEELKLFLQALSIQETGWDNSKTVGSHNVYNIKDPSGKGTRAYDRREGSNDAYRNFKSREEADQEVIALLRRRYPDALTATTIEEFTDALRRGGYATDANHGAGIRKIYYRLKNGEAPAPTPVQERQSIDFSRYEANYGDKIRKARADGFDDETIMRTIQRDENAANSASAIRSKIDAARPRAEIDVAARLARSGQWIDGVAYLATLPGFKEEINYAKGIGKTDEEIIRFLTPGAITGMNAYQKRRGTSVVRDIGDGLLDQLDSYALGARQFFNFDEERARVLQDEEARRRMDPERIALGETVGATIGGVLPDIAAGVLSGGSSLAGTAGRRIGLAAAEGGVFGALNPTVEGESRTGNAALGAVLSGGAGAAVEGAVKYAGRTSDKVRNLMAHREVPYDDDVRARTVSTRISNDLGIPLSENSPYIDEDWITKTQIKLSNEYDDVLDNNGFVMPEEARIQLLDPNFRKSFTAEELKEIDELLYEMRTTKKLVSRQSLDENGNVRVDPRQTIVRDETGAPVREDYQQIKVREEPETELDYAPRTAYQQNPPKMRRVQKIGEDGNVETSTRRRPVYDEDGNQKEIIRYRPEMPRQAQFTIEPAYETFRVPKYEYQQFPGQATRKQVLDDAGQVIMDPKRKKVRDDQGNVVMKQVQTVLNKTRTKMETTYRPKMDLVEIEVPEKVLRQSPISLREAHNLMRVANARLHAVNKADYVDPFKRDAAERLKNLVDDAFYNGAVINPQWAETKLPGQALPEDFLKTKLSDLNQRYAKFSVAKDVFRSTAAEGSTLGDAGVWEKILKSRDYGSRLVKGEAPLNDVLKGLQENRREMDRIAGDISAAKTAGSVLMTAGFATGQPVLGTIGAGVNLLGRSIARVRSNPDAGLKNILKSPTYPVAKEQLEQIQDAAAKKIVRERRVQNLGGDKRIDDKKRKVLKRALDRRPIPIINPDDEE